MNPRPQRFDCVVRLEGDFHIGSSIVNLRVSFIRTLQSSKIEILPTLPDRKGGIWSKEFVSEDLGQEDVVGHVLGVERHTSIRLIHSLSL